MTAYSCNGFGVTFMSADSLIQAHRMPVPFFFTSSINQYEFRTLSTAI
jgi:hypothetical protein